MEVNNGCSYEFRFTINTILDWNIDLHIFLEIIDIIPLNEENHLMKGIALAEHDMDTATTLVLALNSCVV